MPTNGTPANGTPSVVGLIPARAGSVRVRDKNVRPLNGHPVLAYSIRSALDSGVFDDVIVSTDSELYADIARHYGASVPFRRPDEYAGARSPDSRARASAAPSRSKRSTIFTRPCGGVNRCARGSVSRSSPAAMASYLDAAFQKIQSSSPSSYTARFWARASSGP